MEDEWRVCVRTVGRGRMRGRTYEGEEEGGRKMNIMKERKEGDEECV